MAKTLRKGLFTLLLSLCLVCFGAMALINANTNAKAGNQYDMVLDENFSSQELGTDWAGQKAGITFNSGEKPVYIAKSPKTGTSISSTVPVSGSAIRIQIDIVELDFGDLSKDNGWFGVVYNMKTATEAPIDSQNNRDKTNSDGFFFQYKPADQMTGDQKPGIVFAAPKGGATSFIKGDGSAVSKVTKWNFYDASFLDNDGDETTCKILNTSIILEFDNAGNGKIYTKEIDEEGFGELVIETKGGGLRGFDPVTYPYVGAYFSESTGKIANLEVSDIVISSVDSGEVFNCFSKENEKKWYVCNTAEYSFFGFESSLAFGSTFEAGQPIILNKLLVVNDVEDQFDSYVEIRSDMNVTNVTEGSRFGLLAGIEKRSSALLGTAKTTFIYFTKIGGEIYIGAESYHEEGVPTKIFETKIDGGLLNLYVKLGYKGHLNITIGEDEIYASEEAGEAYAVKYVGYVSEGDSYKVEGEDMIDVLNVEVLTLEIHDRYYSRPENAEIELTFDDGGYNVNEWYLYYTRYMGVPTNGAYVTDGKLVFENCAYNTSFATRKQFSNFDFQMDIDDIRREIVRDAAGNKNYPVSSLVGVYFGVTDATHQFAMGVGSQYPHVYIEGPVDVATWDRVVRNGEYVPTTIRMQGNGLNASFELPEYYDFWDKENEGKVLQFRVNVIDNVLNAYVRYKGETEWCNTARDGRTIGGTMTGTLTGNVGITTMGCNYFVPVTSEGHSCGYFSADNIIIKNLDDTPNLVEVDYETSFKELPTDFEYVDPITDYSQYDPTASNSGCGSAIDPGTVAIVALSGSAALWFVKHRRDKKDD